MKRFAMLLKRLGPGILFAGAAVGVSHLVQSTRAGATFGFGLLWAVLLANALKYPFFEFGARYASVTGNSLVMAYKKQGKLILAVFLVVSLLTVFTIQSAVTAVTAGISQFILPLGDGAQYWSLILLLICFILLVVGRFSVLDRLIKIVIIALTISTFIAVIAGATGKPVEKPIEYLAQTFDWKDAAHIAFLIGLMGWMPAPIDLSVWHSIWAIEKRKIQSNFGHKQALLDFNVGYVGTALLACLFLALGAMIMHGSAETFSPSGAKFSSQLISMYTLAIGDWSKWLICIAALTTMFSTTLTCFDAIPRVLARTCVLLDFVRSEFEERLRMASMVVLLIGATLIISLFSGQMLQLVQLATISSFLTAPFFAFANYRAVTSAEMGVHQTPVWLRLLALCGMIFLTGFSLYYLYSLV